MQAYLDLLRRILDDGRREVRPHRHRHAQRVRPPDALRPDRGFPLVTTKKVHTRSIFDELLWFLRGDTNVKWLQEHGVTIWDEWADADGDLGPSTATSGARGRRPTAGTSTRSPRSSSRSARDPDSPPPHRLGLERRRHPATWRWRRATRCSSSTSPDAAGRLSCQLYQRSADVFLGVPFNIASYALLTHMVAQVTGLEAGDFVHTLGDAHLYSNHLEQARAAAHPRAAAAADAAARPVGDRDRRLRPRAHRRRGLRPAPGHQGPHRRMSP